MKIAIDASRANKDQKTGVEWYSYHLIQELKKIITPPSPGNTSSYDKLRTGSYKGQGSFITAQPISLTLNKGEVGWGCSDNGQDFNVILYTNEKLKGGLEVMPKNWQEKILNWPPKYLWTQIRLWWELILNPPDILLVPAHTIPFLPVSRKIKVIVTVHDVGFKRFPKLYKKIQYWYHDWTMKRIRSRANIILTVSEFSKKEIIELYQVDPAKIRIAHLGYDSIRYKKLETVDPAVFTKYKITRPYLLFIGRIEKKKNVLNMIKAFDLIVEKKPALKLVLAGGSGNISVEAEKLVEDLNLKSKVIFTGYVSEEDTAVILSQAEIFLFSTLYEGFGIPILEAMACGVPVVTSNQNPHQEVAGGSAILVNPHQPAEIAGGVLKILNDDKLKQNLIKLGLTRVEKFSWAGLAQKVAEILQKL